MFETQEAFLAWLETQASPELQATLEGQPEDFLAGYREIFDRYGDVRGDYDLLKISGNLGKAIPEVMQLTAKGNDLQEPEALKSFVLASSIALFRLIDRGPSGTEHHLAHDPDSDMPPIFGPDADMEEAFVRPLAEQGFEQVSRVFRGLEPS